MQLGVLFKLSTPSGREYHTARLASFLSQTDHFSKIEPLASTPDSDQKAGMAGRRPSANTCREQVQ